MSNRFSGAFREAVLIAYEGLGGHTAFLEWARENRTEYYRIAARLIPVEMQEGKGAGNVITVLIRGRDHPSGGLGVPAVLEDRSTDVAETTDIL